MPFISVLALIVVAFPLSHLKDGAGEDVPPGISKEIETSGFETLYESGSVSKEHAEAQERALEEMITEEVFPTAAVEMRVEEQVRGYFSDIPVMTSIAWCESKFYHRDEDGKVVRGVVHQDIGVMQINEYYHRKAAERMGLELYDLDDHLRYARHLYEREGTRPWKSSKHCWGGNLAYRH